MQHAVTLLNFEQQPSATQKSLVIDYVREHKKRVWMELIQKAALDASNHEYLMTSTPFQMECVRGGEVLLRAKDVIPELYFAGCDIERGVYVIAMSAEEGSIKKIRNYTSKNVAMLERALLTLAAVGVEHGDLHSNNIFIFDNVVKVIDFGMSAILPERFQKHARERIVKAVRHLLITRTWPESITNSIWYGSRNGSHTGSRNGSHNATNGTMRYLNSYMAEKHGSSFNWYNPSGKMMKLTKALSKKDALDTARYRLWTGLCVKSENIINLTTSPTAQYTTRHNAPLKRQRMQLNYGDL